MEIWASINFMSVLRKGIGQACTGCIPRCSEDRHAYYNVTWYESMTHFTSGSFAQCDKGSKNVNKFSVSANLAYYLRTSAEQRCLVDNCLFLDRKTHKAKSLCGGGKFWFDVRLNTIRRLSILFFFICSLGITSECILFPSWFRLTSSLPPLDTERNKQGNNAASNSSYLFLHPLWPFRHLEKVIVVLFAADKRGDYLSAPSNVFHSHGVQASGCSQTHVPRGQSVTRTAAPNTAQTSGQKAALSTSQPRYLTDYTDF